jgi:hypothetical protein
VMEVVSMITMYVLLYFYYFYHFLTFENFAWIEFWKSINSCLTLSFSKQKQGTFLINLVLYKL